MPTEPLTLFISYSHKDEPLREELGSHLRILERQQLITIWHDRKILAGDEWDHQINTSLETADIILLLISSDFLASSYCWDIEIQRAMQLHESGQSCVIPVILRSVDWTSAPFGKLQAVPRNAQPVTLQPDRDAAFEFVTKQIRQVAIELSAKREKQREQAKKEEAIARYRQQFEEFAADGEISFGERFVLDRLKQDLGLSDEEVQAIEQNVVRPPANQQALDQYRKLFEEAIAKYGYPFSAKVAGDLKLVQTHLKLTDAHVTQVLAAVIAPQEGTQQELQQSPSSHSIPTLQSFDFQTGTLTVDYSELLGMKVTCDINQKLGRGKLFAEDMGNGVRLEVVNIPGGTFQMGSPENEEGRDSDEGPQHQVAIQPFFLGKFAVTQEQWKAIAILPRVNTDLNPDPSKFKGTNRPVEQISWFEAVEFCDRLSQKTNRNYRLPSEAEWEYACRAGTTTPFHFGATITTEIANYNGNYIYGSAPKGEYREQTKSVGSFAIANAFGLYDMHGNVWEWCADLWHENYQNSPTDGSAWMTGGDGDRRLLRGGSWYYAPRVCRSAYRDRGIADARSNFIGFRVALSA